MSGAALPLPPPKCHHGAHKYKFTSPMNHTCSKVLRGSTDFTTYMYITVQNTTYVYQRVYEISVTSGPHVSAVKQSSIQCRTYTRYNISVHSMGSHIVYSKS